MNCLSLIIKLSVALTLAFGASISLSNELSADQLFEKISPSVWVVNTFEKNGRPLSRGSAVVVAPGALITNCHVLAKASSLVIRRDNVTYDAKLKHADPDRDLCLVEVRNFHAPSVEVAPTERLKVGQRVYAIGNPRGLELTFSDGLISGLRQGDNSSTVELIQTSAPVSAGSSGGGLFDTQGRLVGVTTSTLRDGQNLNFAMPSNWIAEVPTRAQAALNARNNTSGTNPVPAKRGDYYVGQEWEYVIIDRMTKIRKSAVLRVDRFEGQNVFFNGGERSENMMGRVLHSKQRVLSELDSLNHIGGWVNSHNAQQLGWTVNTDVHMEAGSRLELSARFAGESKLTTPAGDFDVSIFKFTGFRQLEHRPGISSRGTFEATAWYSKAINRMIKFSYQIQGGFGRSDEEIVLQAIR